MNVDLAALASRICNEINSVVENAGDVLTNVVFQVVRLVLDPFLLKVVFREIGGTIHNVSDADLLEHGLILCDEVGPEPHKAIDDFGANPLVELIFIFFTGGALKIEIFVIQLIGCHFVSIKISGRTIALALHT